MAQKALGIKGKMFAKKRYAEKALMKKTLAMHDESSTRRKVDDNVHEGAIPAYLLDREETTRAKVLSNTIKQKRKEKAGKCEVPLPKVVEASTHCCAHFGYKNSTPYMPHLSLLYGDLSDEEKKAAGDKAYALDDSIVGLTLQISRIALYKTDTEDKSCKSWEKVAECLLKP